MRINRAPQNIIRAPRKNVLKLKKMWVPKYIICAPEKLFLSDKTNNLGLHNKYNWAPKKLVWSPK